MVEYVILGISIAAMLAGIIWFIVKALKGDKLPKGKKYEASHDGNKAIMVVHPDVSSIKDKGTGKVKKYISQGEKLSGDDLAKKCAVAMETTEKAFDEVGREKADEKEVVFWFVTDEEFDTHWNGALKNSASYADRTDEFIGDGRPLVVMRSKHMATVSKRGQPAIHELVHVLNKDVGEGYNRDHSDSKLWVGHGVNTAEAISVSRWKDVINKDQTE